MDKNAAVDTFCFPVPSGINSTEISVPFRLSACLRVNSSFRVQFAAGNPDFWETSHYESILTFINKTITDITLTGPLTTLHNKPITVRCHHFR